MKRLQCIVKCVEAYRQQTGQSALEAFQHLQALNIPKLLKRADNRFLVAESDLTAVYNYIRIIEEIHHDHQSINSGTGESA